MIEYSSTLPPDFKPVAKRSGKFDIYSYKIDRQGNVLLFGKVITSKVEGDQIPRLNFNVEPILKFNLAFDENNQIKHIFPQESLTDPSGKEFISNIILDEPSNKKLSELFKKRIADNKEEVDAADAKYAAEKTAADAKYAADAAAAADKLETDKRLKKLYAEEKEDEPFWEEYKKTPDRNDEEWEKMAIRRKLRQDTIKSLKENGARLMDLVSRDRELRTKEQEQKYFDIYIKLMHNRIDNTSKTHSPAVPPGARTAMA